MSDFTKEELEELLLGYELHSHNTRHNWPSLDLVKKLKSMIDNYCEHNGRPYIKETSCCGTKLFYGSDNYLIAKCGKCGKKLNDNQ